MKINFKIKKATFKNLDPISKMFDDYRVFYRKSPDINLSRRFISDRLIKKDSCILIAISSSGKIMGFTQLYPSFSSVAAKKIFVLNDLFVNDEFRRMGVAKKLIEESIGMARKLHCARVDLATEKINKGAQKLYYTMGFVENYGYKYYNKSIAK